MSQGATTPPPDDRYARGLEILRVVGGQHDPAVVQSLADLAPDVARFTVEFAYGDVYARPGLTWRERQLVTVAALTALGNAPTQLHFHVRGALEVGATPREITETIAHVSVYAGFPAALNGLATARTVFTEIGTAVETEPAGRDGGDESRYERGLRLLSEIDGDAGHRVVESLGDVAPDLGRYLVEFAFGDIYAGTGIDLRMRELVTVAACTALGTATPQLRLHIGGCLNVGGTREEVVEVITQMAVYAGFPAALNALAAAREAFAAH